MSASTEEGSAILEETTEVIEERTSEPPTPNPDYDVPRTRTFTSHSLGLPNQLSTVNNVPFPFYTELQLPMGSAADVSHTWSMNYQEAAIFLEEGENNDKFDFHPRNKEALPTYLIVHNHVFYSLDLVAAILLMSLSLVEQPAVPGLSVPTGVHASLELFGLFVMGIELAMKVRWMGTHSFFTHKRTMMKLITLFIMFIEALVVLIRQTSHVRVTRALRPVFLIDNHYCEGVRRFTRQILQSLPPILDMLILLFFFMLIFSVLGFYLFATNLKDPNFSTLKDSFISLFILLTTANYPDVMMPSYAKSYWSAVFFICFLVIHLYLLMNLMLAVVYETFTRLEKDKFRKLWLHRRKACQSAFALLVSKSSPNRVSFRHFEGLMHFYKPKSGRRDVYLMFKTLDKDRSGYLTLEEFYHVLEVSALKWRPKRAATPWYDSLSENWKLLFLSIYNLVTWKWFECVVNIIILANGIWQILEAVKLSGQHTIIENISSTWVGVGFVSFYIFEAGLKILAYGPTGYFRSGWNMFDFTVTLIAGAGLIAEFFKVPFAFMVILRPLRLLRLFKLKRNYRDVLGTFFIVIPRFSSVALVLIVVYYFFAIICMECFSAYDMVNCCKNTSVEQNFIFTNSSEGYFYLNNFSNIVQSFVTLFELMVVNNWFILMNGYASVAGEWSRVFFMVFYICTMVVLNIVVAFILEAFLFRIQYKNKMGDMDKDSLVKVDVALSREELDFSFGNVGSNNIQEMMIHEQEMSQYSVVYRGTRMRTKYSFSLRMYDDELKDWIRDAEEEERRQKEAFISHVQQLRSNSELASQEYLLPRHTYTL